MLDKTSQTAGEGYALHRGGDVGLAALGAVLGTLSRSSSRGLSLCCLDSSRPFRVAFVFLHRCSR